MEQAELDKLADKFEKDIVCVCHSAFAEVNRLKDGEKIRSDAQCKIYKKLSGEKYSSYRRNANVMVVAS